MKLRIGSNEYPLKSAELYIEFFPEGRTATFSLYAEHEANTTGITLNSQVIEGIAGVSGLTGLVFKATPHPEDDIPAIADCSVYEQGKTFDLKALTVRFGSAQGDRIQVDVNATAFEIDEETMQQVGSDKPISVSCTAILKVEQAE